MGQLAWLTVVGGLGGVVVGALVGGGLVTGGAVTGGLVAGGAVATGAAVAAVWRRGGLVAGGATGAAGCTGRAIAIAAGPPGRGPCVAALAVVTGAGAAAIWTSEVPAVLAWVRLGVIAAGSADAVFLATGAPPGAFAVKASPPIMAIEPTADAPAAAVRARTAGCGRFRRPAGDEAPASATDAGRVRLELVIQP